MSVFYLMSLVLFFFCAAVLAFMTLIAQGLTGIILDISLMSLSGVRLTLPVLIDQTSLSFSMTVLVISGSVLFFSKFYMKHEKYFLRFHFLVCLFVGSMLLLIFSPNLVALILGWDGLGVTSFLLVVYFNSHKSFNAGMLTALTNRIGDCLLLLAMAFFLSLVPLNFFLYAWFDETAVSLPMAALVMVAASTKSAQVPFSAWLPAAMAAPTPVSSLVHSSTLVTAGVYLLLRFNHFLSAPLNKLLFMMGTMTMIMASVSALFESDMKKIIALSTLSQLGLMMSGVGMEMLELSLFHLLTHAFFKAMMFMAVGSIIHSNNGIQDLRITAVRGETLGPSLGFLLVSNFSLMGLPYMGGFYSKDLLIEATLALQLSVLEEVFFYAAVALSVAYSLRFMMIVVWGSLGFNSLSWVEDSDGGFFWSLVTLWLLAITGGSLLSWAWLTPSFFVAHSGFKSLIILMILGGATVAPMLASPQSHKIRAMSWGAGNLWGLPLVSPSLANPSYWVSKSAHMKLDSSFIPFSLMMVFYSSQKLSLRSVKAITLVEWSLIGFILLFILLSY